MSVKIVCPNCKEEFDYWKSYASHILEEHEEDKERCVWAKNALDSGDGSGDSIVTTRGIKGESVSEWLKKGKR